MLQDNLSADVSLSFTHLREFTGERLCCNCVVSGSLAAAKIALQYI